MTCINRYCTYMISSLLKFTARKLFPCPLYLAFPSHPFSIFPPGHPSFFLPFLHICLVLFSLKPKPRGRARSTRFSFASCALPHGKEGSCDAVVSSHKRESLYWGSRLSSCVCLSQTGFICSVSWINRLGTMEVGSAIPSVQHIISD